MKDIDHKTLLCDEDLFLSSPTSPKQAQNYSFSSFSLNANGILQDQEVEREEVFMDYHRREKDYTPCNGYSMKLDVSANLRAARSKAVQYIIDVCKRLDVSATTVFNAVNYLDRFLSLCSSLKWEIWMVELVSISCASLACKFYDTSIPSLYDLQMEHLEHTFKPVTIQEMEITILKALDWRLSCVTAFSFANLMLGPTRSGPMIDKVTRLLLHSLLDPLMTKFKASIIATSALKCATEEKDGAITMLNKIHVDEMDHVENCTKILKAHLQAIDIAGGGIQVKLVNHCNQSLWPGVQGTGDHPAPNLGGFHMGPMEEAFFEVPFGWSGRVWARQGCFFDKSGNGTCQTGNCGNQLHCNGLGASPPITMVEMTFGTENSSLSYYDVSLVDGFNIPVSMSPIGGGLGCRVAGCEVDLNVCCPSRFEFKSSDGKVVGCMSACLALRTDKYCCTGQYGSPDMCKPTLFSHLFKSICPRAYSFAFDDKTSLNVCKATRYLITFCPPMR
ncbi:Thaumatin-like protein [Carex littledalei]|uniref:Thaumatin-like protein n=1 Tax=Carex littledalei TaxID=544730 RepID=A0A833QH33_9POAL|nr:Thaumatin-like protein [Carex littledalei]